MKSSSQQMHQHQHPYQQPQPHHHHPKQHQLLRDHPTSTTTTSMHNGLAGCDNISEKLGIGPEVRELKLGPTFLSGKPSTAFHTIKYDFKPASVDTSKMATVDVGDNNTMTVTVPHLDGAGVPQTVFKGSQRPYTKECVLIIDNITGEITLERLSCNIQVKKTRSEMKAQSLLSLNSQSGIRPITPIDSVKNPMDGRTKSRTKVTSGKKREPSHQLRPKQSPQRASYHGKSPPMKSPSSTSNSNSISCSAMPSSSQSLGSLPIISEHDDFPLIVPPAPTTAALPSLSSPPSESISTSSITATSSNAKTTTTTTSHSTAPPRTRSPAVSEKPSFVSAPILDNEVGILSDSSSSDSSSDSSDSESDAEQPSTAKVNGHVAANGAKTSPPMPDSILLNEDLQLSESESDSD